MPLRILATDIQPGFACQPTDGPDGCAQLRTNNVSTDGRIDLTEVKRVPATTAQIQRFRLAPGDVLFNNTNSPALVGKTAYFSEEGLFLFSNHMTRIRVRLNMVDPRYLARYLHRSWSQGVFRSLVTQWVNQAAINRTQLASVRIPLPPLSEQRRIVEILDQADRLRRLRAEADAKADRILPALFIKMFGDPLRLLSHPSSRPLSSFKVDMQNGFACGEKDVPGGIPHLRMNNISDTGRLDLRLVRTVPSGAYSERYRLSKGDVLFMSTNSKDKIGKACVFEPPVDGKCLFSNHLIRIRSSDPELIPEYLATFLHLLWRSGFYSGIAKRWVNQATVSRRALGTVHIPAFEREEQVRFARALRQMSVHVLGAEAARDQLDALFSLILHRGFSGSLTASWREAHMKELLQEMEQQAKALEEVP